MTALRWTVADSWTVAGRDLTSWVRQPGVLAAGVAFPVLMLLMFGYLFGGGFAVPEGVDYRELLVPGVLGLTMVFGVEATMVAVNADAAKGITDRFRSMPMAPGAVVIGRSVADMLNSALALAVLLACGLLVGWRAHDGLGRFAAAVGLLLLLRLACLWAGIHLGLVARDPSAVVAVQILVWPLAFASNAFVDPATMPGWLGAVAEWNPLSATVGAARELFGNPGWDGDSWAAQHSVLLAVLWPVLLVAVFGPLAARRYRRLSR
jgi:ABC-type multidrug transport system permease subunit